MMSHELWSTYSVKDHLAPRDLVPDILLFDRLVFPVPETAQFPENSGSPAESGLVQWTRNPEEWARWEAEHWKPNDQSRLLELLTPVIRKVPWDEPHQKEWRQETANRAARHLPDWAFVMTRTILTRDLPAYVTGVAAVGPAYRSIEQLENGLGIQAAHGTKPLPGSCLPAVLGWEFLSPEDDRLTDNELLTETVAFVTGDADFRRYRMEFIEWQERFLKDGTTDRESLERAVKEMRGLLEESRNSARKLTVHTVARYAFMIAPSALTLGLTIAGIPDGILAAAGGAFLSVGGIAVEGLFFKDAEQKGPTPAAFVHHVRRHFGWK